MRIIGGRGAILRACIWAATAAALPLAASAQQEAPPAALDSLFKCKAIGDAAARLACYDRETGKLQAADTKGDLMVANREDVQKAKRGLFGLNVHLGLFDHRDTGNQRDDDEIKEITAKITHVDNSSGYWVVTLDNGATWQQTEARTLGRYPKAGMTVTIRRAALGSYRMSFGGGPAVKARRLN